jgi:hypothetical protein
MGEKTKRCMEAAFLTILKLFVTPINGKTGPNLRL